MLYFDLDDNISFLKVHNGDAIFQNTMYAMFYHNIDKQPYLYIT